MPGSPKKRERRERTKRAVELGLLAEGEKIVPPSVQSLIPEDPPVFSERDLAPLRAIAVDGSAEEFQKALGMVLRRLMVTGLKNIGEPKTIKDLQAIADMIRKSEGIDGKGGGMGGGLVGPRMVTRGPIRGAVGPIVEAEESDGGGSEVEPADQDAPEPDEEFEI